MTEQKHSLPECNLCLPGKHPEVFCPNPDYAEKSDD